MPSPKIEQCVTFLLERNFKIAFAESATAGRFASEIALVKDSGKILLGGIVCYDATVKTSLLKVPQQYIDQFTAESAEVTKALAENLKSLFNANVSLAVTGLPTPGGSETTEKPVGTMFIHLICENGYISHREVFAGTPEEVIAQTIERGCELILQKCKTQNTKLAQKTKQ